MERAQNDRIRAEDLECEFIPPLDLPETHGLPAEQLLCAARAWQEAGGNVDDGTDPQTDAKDAATERQLPTMRTITRMNTVLVSLRERLQQIQIEAANVAIGEMSLRQAETLNPEDAFSALHAEHCDRIEALAASWCDLLAMAQANMAAIPGFLPAGTRTGGTPRAAEQPWLLSEQRHHSVTIDFPDRRAAA